MSSIKKSIENNIATLTIDRPPVNALNSEVMKELDASLAEVIADASVKVVIITGGGQKVFVAGADIKEIAQIQGADKAYEMARAGQQILNRLENSTKPVIAAINGVCLGGGMELVMACHIRVASDRCRFAQPEISLGMIPGFGGTQRLSRIVGLAKATELILTGDVITPKEAIEMKLVNHVVRDGALLKTAKEIAKKISQKGLLAIQAAMTALRDGRDKPLDQGLDQEAKLFADLVKTNDFREGMKAFAEKRQPKFSDS